MAAEISDCLREIADARGLPESAVFEEALERGIEDLWEDVVLTRYFEDDLSRSEVVEADVDWGLNA